MWCVPPRTPRVHSDRVRIELIVLILALIVPISSSAEEEPKCARIKTTELEILAPSLREKIGTLEPRLKGSVEIQSGLVCGSVLLAWYYVPPQSANEVDLSHLSWDLESGRSRLGSGG